MMGLLSSQVSDLKREREILLDRLATFGLGGPLFSSPAWPDSSESTEGNTAEGPTDSEAKEIEKLMNSCRRRPSKLADALTRKTHRDYNRKQAGPSVKWIPKVEAVTAALDEAEASGKKQA
jgi:hypothetical protein